MADQTDIEMRKKYLHYVKPSMNMIDVAIREFEVALDNRGWLDDNELNIRAFLPHMAGLKGGDTEVNRIIVAGASATSGINVYKINAPGFFYYQHYKGDWDPSGYIQLLVSSNRNFTSNVFELMNTNGNGNDHVNNMFPIRPGSSTYVMARGTFASMADKKQLFFAPAWKISPGNAMQSAGTANWPSRINDDAPNSESFKNCFR